MGCSWQHVWLFLILEGGMCGWFCTFLADAVVVVDGAGVEVVAGLLPTAATIHVRLDQKEMTIQFMDSRQRVEGHAQS